MIPRRANKKDSSTQYDTVLVEQSQNEHKSITNNSDEEVVHEVDLKSISSPTFNIHIHVPYYEPNNAKLFLPRIQPIIHLHFDEIAKRLASSTKGQSEKSLSKTIENLLAKTSPKFGNVKFHFKIDSEDKDVEDHEKINEIPCSSVRPNNDALLNEKNNSSSVSIQNLVSESNEFDPAGHSSNNNNNNNNNNTGKSKFKKSLNILDPYKCKFDENIKLKKAVVVLTDICKNKNYQNILARNKSAKNQSNYDESLYDIVDKMDEYNNINEESESYIIKAEKESCTSMLFTPNGCKNNNSFSDSCPADISGNHQVEKEVSKSPLINLPGRDQNLTSLVEGWSFSDILNRFQIKHSEYLVNSAKYLKSDRVEYDGSQLELNRERVEGECLEEHVEEQTCNDNDSHFELNENKLAFKECSSEIEYESEGTVSPSLLVIKNEAENNISESELNGRGPILEEVAAEVKTEVPENNDLDSDVCENILRKEMGSEVNLDLDLVEPDLSNNNKSDSVSENNFEEGRIMNSSLNDPGFHLYLIQKEILRRALTTPVLNKTPNKLKKNKSPEVQLEQPEITPSPKKMKHSEKETKHSRKNLNALTEEDYILLNSPGPTQFAVASLDKVTPYKTHEAKNFREKVLFGDRVNRFSSPEKLQILKLKREATRKLLDK